MPSRKPSRSSPMSGPPPRRQAPVTHPSAHEVVDPRWLAKALGLTVVAAIVCAWLALCGLYYQGSWQLVLRPVKSIAQTPAAAGIPFHEIRFDASDTGQPRLTGWWISAAMPAASPQSTASNSDFKNLPQYAADTILYLHDGHGSLSDTLPTLKLLHNIGINIFAIDYRGYGQSELSVHPNSERMTADAAAALAYLTGTRHLPFASIIPYGAGLGASLAVYLAESHPELPAVILDNPDPDPTTTAVGAHPSHLVPIRLLYHEHFDIAGPLRTLPTPKLLIAGGPNASSETTLNQLQTLFRTAAAPSISVIVPGENYDADFRSALTRLLDQYLPAAGSTR